MTRKSDEADVPEDERRVRDDLRERPSLARPRGLAVEHERPEDERGGDAGRHEEDGRDPEPGPHLAREDRPEEAAEVHERVVDGVAEGLRLLGRRPRDGPDDARLDERAADRRDDEGEDDVALLPERVDERLPGRQAREPDERVPDAEDREAGEEAALEAEPVHDDAREDREAEDEAAVDPDEVVARRAEPDRAVQVDGEDRLGAVEREALEQLEDVRDPERAREARAENLESCGEIQESSGARARTVRRSGRR